MSNETVQLKELLRDEQRRRIQAESDVEKLRTGSIIVGLHEQIAEQSRLIERLRQENREMRRRINAHKR